MKLVEKTGVLERSGDFQESGFRIAASSKAFEILSSKLYSDIPRAVIRELSTNAYDAHVEAGHPDKAFQVHLPNYLEPWFEIRDFGTGLSPEAVREIYTVYFASTRNESDEFTGCLGLGSKSPFAYSDQFLVTSFQGGYAHTYSLFKNEKGLPSIALLSQNETDEPNGIGIKIGVKSQDFHLFSDAASKVYAYFKVKPNIVGAQVNLTPKVAEICGSNYNIYAGNSYNESIVVIMGQVCYKVSQIDISQHGFHPYTNLIELHANIGDCSIAASREELHMDERTKDFIQERLKAVLEDLRAKMLVEMSTAKTTLEKIYVQNRYCQRIQGLRNTIRLEGELKDKYSVNHLELQFGRRSGSDRKLYISNHFIDFNHCVASKPVMIVENDCGTELSVKLRKRLIFWRENIQGKCESYLATIQDRAAFEEAFGSPVARLSSLPDPPRAQADRSLVERNKSCLRQIKLGGEQWENITEFGETEDAAIVLRDGDKVMFNGVSYNRSALEPYMKAAGVKVVYGIPARLYNKYDGPLEDLFEMAKAATISAVGGMNDFQLASLKQPGSVYFDTSFLKKVSGISTEAANFSRFAEARQTISDSANIRSMANIFGIEILDKPNYEAIFLGKYPLLKALNYDEISRYHDEVVAYMKAKELQ